VTGWLIRKLVKECSCPVLSGLRQVLKVRKHDGDTLFKMTASGERVSVYLP